MDPSLALSVTPRSEHMQVSIAELQRIEDWQTENGILEEDLPTIPVDSPPKKSIKKRLQSLLTRKKQPKKGEVVEVAAEVETREDEEDDTISEYENLTALPPMPKVTVTPVEEEVKEKRKPRKLVKKRSVYVREEERVKEEEGVGMSMPNRSAFFYGERGRDERKKGEGGKSGFMSLGNKSMFFFKEKEVKDKEKDEDGGESEAKTLSTKKSMWF